MAVNHKDSSHSHHHKGTGGNEHSHHHHHGRDLLWATLLNAIITVAEIIGGIMSNSLALLSDAIHNLGDTVAVLLAYIANKISRRSANNSKTFGYRRVEILAALLNAFIIIAITIYLFYEAWLRFQNPEPIKGMLMFVVASIGLIANLFAMLLLRKNSKENINIKAAYLHLLGDTISSVAVIIGSVLIYFFDIFWIDPIITVVIGVYILKEAYAITKQSVNILMQASPSDIDIIEIKEAVEDFVEISNIHHLHVWNLTDSRVHFECHAEFKFDIKISEAQKVVEKIETLLKNNYGISHVTIQIGFNCCEQKELIKTD